MKRVVRFVAVLLVAFLAFLADTQSPSAMGASSAFPTSQGRVCPAQKPYPVNGTMNHRRRDAVQESGSDRFLVRLADEDDNPDRVIDHAVTAPDGTYRLCYAQSDIISNQDTFVARGFSAFAPDVASWIMVQKTDVLPDFTYFSHLYSWPVSVSISQGQEFVHVAPFAVPPGTAAETGFRIKDDIQIGYDFVGGTVGDNDVNDKLWAEWPHNVPFASQSFFCYDPPLGFGCTERRVYLKQFDGESLPNSQTRRWVVLHEVGHHVMYNRYGNWMPAPSVNYWALLAECDDHRFGVQIPGEKDCIWQEDWANFFASAALRNPAGGPNTESYQDWDLEIGRSSWPTGDGTEGRVSGALWDMLDVNSDGGADGDFYSTPFSSIYGLILPQHRAATFEVFWDKWKQTGGDKCASTSINRNTIVYSEPDWAKCDLEARWNYTEGSGTSVADSVGGHHGTFVGGGFWTTGLYGTPGDAGEFYGQGPYWDYVNVPAHANFDTPSVSASMWVKPLAIRTQGIVYKDFTTWGPDWTAWRVFMNSNGSVTFDARAGLYSITSWQTLPVSKWAHIAVTYDAGAKVMKLYLNGTLQGTASNADAINAPYSHPVVMGREEWSYLDGAIDLARYYKRALTQDQVRALGAENLRANWAHYEGGWRIIADSTGSGFGSCSLGQGFFDCNNLSADPPGKTGVWGSGITGFDANDQFAGRYWGQGGPSSLWNYTQIPPSPAFNTPDFTLSMWVWPAATRFQGFAYKDFTTWSPSTMNWRLSMDSIGRARFDAKADTYVLNSSATLPVFQWTHVAITYEATVQEMKIYINGSLQGTLGGASGVNTDLGLQLVLGREEWSYFDGALDFVRYYSRTLAPGEIWTLYSWQ